jgi:uracil-DNA glycosylase
MTWRLPKWLGFDETGIPFTRAHKQALDLRLLAAQDETRSECAVTVLLSCQASRRSRDNLDENGGGNQGLKRRPVARS